MEAALRFAVGQDVYFLKRILVPYNTGGLNTSASLIKYDELRGWALNPHSRKTVGEGQAAVRPHNSLGMRDPDEYSDLPEDGVTRIAIFGDSFTYGFEVEREQSYPYLLEKMESGTEVLNFGVPGYGTDQAYLTYRKLRATRPDFTIDLVLIGFTIENIYRNVNILRPAYSMTTGLPFTKPRYVIAEDGTLKLENLPPVPPDKLADLYRNPESYPMLEHETYRLPTFAGSRLAFSFLFRFACQSTDMIRRLLKSNDTDLASAYGSGTEEFRITSMILRQFCRDAEAAGSRCLVVLIPGASDLPQAQTGTRPWVTLTDYLRENQIDFLDLSDRFIEALDSGSTYHDIYINGKGHFSAQGNRLVASLLSEHIVH
jgi:hypothetical protein